MPEALVLNATYEPLCVVPGRRAVVLVLTAKAVAVAGTDEVVHSARVDLPVPAVVRLTRYVRVPFRATVPLTRKAVFARDGGRCVYCEAPATSLDHVVPRSRGGTHTWDNVVSACGRCNHVKADRGVAELGWRLRRPPVAPSGAAWRVVGARRLDPAWRPFLAGLPEPLLPEGHRSDSHRADSHRADSHRPDSHRPDSHRPEGYRPQLGRLDEPA